jgi:lysophospholipase L1-like esterase
VSESASAPQLPAGDAPFFILGANSWNIYAKGQALGNRRTVFSKVGDSITVADVMYRPIGFGNYSLGGYGYLQRTIDFFSQTQARDNNSFNNSSLAAQNGWTTSTVLNPQYANQDACNEGESPLACEYRTTKPAVALIMFGSNDVAIVPSDEFAYNLRVIVEYSIARGVIPVLSTIPPRRGFEPQVAFYNQLVTEIASAYGVSLWDYGAAMRTLPNDGLSGDGLHPSYPPEGFSHAANFTGDYLQYGYVMRNLTALQALDVLRRRVLG